MSADATIASMPIPTTEEAERVMRHLVEDMDALLAMVDEETRLVRAGALRSAAMIEPPKRELARRYVVAMSRLRISEGVVASLPPDLLATFKERHQEFRGLLQASLTVLATAHAVSEGLIRGVSNELARKAAPETYSPTGRANAPSPSNPQPLAVSRLL
jgi:hypothetical protein